jgi:hypothetical protein
MNGVVSMWVVPLPSPEVCTHLVQRLFSLPVQFPIGETRICRQVGDISWATFRNDIGKLTAYGLVEGLDHIKDRAPCTGTKVVRPTVMISRSLLLLYLVQSRNMALRKIHDMKIVAIRMNEGKMVNTLKNH